MYLFVLMFSIVVLIFECHLFACKRHEFPAWSNKTELNWIELNWIELNFRIISHLLLTYQTKIDFWKLKVAVISED